MTEETTRTVRLQNAGFTVKIGVKVQEFGREDKRIERNWLKTPKCQYGLLTAEDLELDTRHYPEHDQRVELQADQDIVLIRETQTFPENPGVWYLPQGTIPQDKFPVRLSPQLIAVSHADPYMVKLAAVQLLYAVRYGRVRNAGLLRADDLRGLKDIKNFELKTDVPKRKVELVFGLLGNTRRLLELERKKLKLMEELTFSVIHHKILKHQNDEDTPKTDQALAAFATAIGAEGTGADKTGSS